MKGSSAYSGSLNWKAALKELAEGNIASPTHRQETIDFLASKGYIQRLSYKVEGLSVSAYRQLWSVREQRKMALPKDCTHC